MKDRQTLMQRLLDAGYPRKEMFAHESDLYVYVNEITRRVIMEWCEDNNYNPNLMCPKFRDNISGMDMYDCAFANDGYWRAIVRGEA